MRDGATCPTSEALMQDIRDRRRDWEVRGRKESILNLSGALQFGLVDEDEEQQLSHARDFWSYYWGSCDNCGGLVLALDDRYQPKCGCLYCDLCRSRGRDDECMSGYCDREEEAVS